MHQNNANQKLQTKDLEKENEKLYASIKSLVAEEKQLQETLVAQQKQHEIDNAYILEGITLGVKEIVEIMNARATSRTSRTSLKTKKR